MPSIFWTQLFLDTQGYDVTNNIIYQDNKSAIILEKNGKAYSGKRTNHINMRYFFMTDRIQKGDVLVKWCPTADMTGDFLTKQEVPWFYYGHCGAAISRDRKAHSKYEERSEVVFSLSSLITAHS